jgi:DNA-binding transcriptional LysR family regulator
VTQHLDNIAVFVKVAEFESISGAARALNMPISTVSRKVAALESELGVSLLRRTTRRILLTSQGGAYFNQCIEPLTRLQEADQLLAKTQKEAEGTLAISVPMILSQGLGRLSRGRLLCGSHIEVVLDVENTMNSRVGHSWEEVS